MLPLIQNAARFRDRCAIVTADGSFSFDQLLEASAAIAATLLDGTSDLAEARVAFLVPPGFDYVAVQWGIWRAGGVAVPLGLMHPPAEWQHVLSDAQVSAIVVSADLRSRIQPLADELSIAMAEIDKPAPDAVSLPQVDDQRRAMILYTSGTTSKPKGVVSTHANIAAQVSCLVDAWDWRPEDRILHVLPLHHIHGIINALACPLWVGATCEFAAGFDAAEVLERMSAGDLTLFMAVPTIYAKLIAQWHRLNSRQQAAVRAGCERMRLMVSGSAALPVATLEQWQAVSGHVLLERYGMTEIGMALSNPLEGERRPGHVGFPLTGVEVRRVDDQNHALSDGSSAGQIEVRGPSVFREYWGKPEATAQSFHDGWFQTGDIAVVDDGYYRILGRSSVDIIKTGGYKVSALEIEEVLRTHPEISECAVVGIEDDEWGQRVAACVVSDRDEIDPQQMRSWGKQHLAAYKVPSLWIQVPELPRNAMGKVQKPAVAEMFPRPPAAQPDDS